MSSVFFTGRKRCRWEMYSDSSVGIVTRLQDGQDRNSGSILIRETSLQSIRANPAAYRISFSSVEMGHLQSSSENIYGLLALLYEKPRRMCRKNLRITK